MDIKVSHNTVIVFDLDDTLYNEIDYLKSAYKSIAIFLEPNHWKPLYSKMFALYRCKMNVFEFLANTYGVEKDNLLDMYRNHNPDIQLFDGVLELFEAIKSKNGKIGLLTDGRSKTQRAKIKSLGIENYIDKIIISEEIGSEKPNVANFKAIENVLPAIEYYYFADNLIKDFITAKTLNWKTIALVDNGKNIHFESQKNITAEHEPHYYILSFKDVHVF